MSSYAVVVESRDVFSGFWLKTWEGTKFIAVKDEWGTRSQKWTGSLNDVENPKVFHSVNAAINFTKKWHGYSYDCDPNGNFEIIEVRPVYKQVQDGYEIVRVIERTP